MIFAPIPYLCYNEKMVIMESQINLSEKNHPAFTLVEMLVVLGIVGLMFGVGMANFFRYRERQEIEQTAYDVQSFIQKIQTYAKNGNRGGENSICNQDILNTKLTAWEITYHSGNNQLIAKPKCLYQGVDTEGTTDVFNLPLNYKLSQFTKITFQAVFGGVIFNDGGTTSPNINLVVSDQNEDFAYQFHVTSGGVITSGCWCPNPDNCSDDKC